MIHELQVDEAAAGERLDVWLERALQGCSRSLLARCIKLGRCRIEPGKAKPGYRLRGGERLVLEVPELEPVEARPEDLPLTVVYEDERLLVIDKPPGMVVHPAIGHLHGTLLNGLLGRAQRDGGRWQPQLIHRLDADTSGVIAVAKDPQTHQRCQDAFRARVVDKRYLALIHGSPRADLLEHDGSIGRHSKDFRKRCVPPDGSGKTAYTRLIVRERHDGWCAVEARPKTGRTHQIRVHLAELRHPVLADALYGRNTRWTPIGGGPTLTRQALHAWRLALPFDGTTRIFHAPIPDDLRRYLDTDLEPLLDADQL